jgi:hypothetical protein
LTLNDRRRLTGLSVAELARRTNLGYDRTWRHFCGSKLEPAEMRLIERTIAAAERERQPV